MADITKCTQESCPLAGTCWRRLAPDKEQWQSWATFNYSIGANGVHCDNYYPTIWFSTVSSTESFVAEDWNKVPS